MADVSMDRRLFLKLVGGTLVAAAIPPVVADVAGAVPALLPVGSRWYVTALRFGTDGDGGATSFDATLTSADAVTLVPPVILGSGGPISFGQIALPGSKRVQVLEFSLDPHHDSFARTHEILDEAFRSEGVLLVEGLDRWPT